MRKLPLAKELVMLVLGLIFSASLITGTAIGQKDNKKTPAPADPSVTQKADETVTINGKVESVSDSALTVVDEKKSERMIALDATTKITKGGKDATLADLKPDDLVVVVAKKGEGDALTAVKITVA
jgi:hypothetical protein